MFWVAAGLQGLSALSSYSADRQQAKASKKMQEFRNKMNRISNALNQNSITTNETLAVQQSAKQAVFMRRDELTTLGSTRVAAAAAGVKGNSVNQTLRDVQRNAGFMERARQTDLQQQFMQFRQQRLSSQFSMEQGMDYSYIPKPSLGATLLGTAANVGMQYAQLRGS